MNDVNAVGGSGGGGGGGWDGMGGAAAAVQSSASNQSQSSGNTYGPLTASECYAGNVYKNSNSFPTINFADDGSTDSPTLAEEMFSRRLGGGGGGGRSGGGGGGGIRRAAREEFAAGAWRCTRTPLPWPRRCSRGGSEAAAAEAAAAARGAEAVRAEELPRREGHLYQEASARPRRSPASANTARQSGRGRKKKRRRCEVSVVEG
ncbi:unnamed protein product [Hapterophycus canaliculatus]